MPSTIDPGLKRRSPGEKSADREPSQTSATVTLTNATAHASSRGNGRPAGLSNFKRKRASSLFDRLLLNTLDHQPTYHLGSVRHILLNASKVVDLFKQVGGDSHRDRLTMNFWSSGARHHESLIDFTMS